MRRFAALLVVLGGWLAARSASAHPLAMSGMRALAFDRQVSVALDLDFRTLVAVLGDELDHEKDGRVVEAEMAASRGEVAAYLRRHLGVSTADTPCAAGEPHRFEVVGIERVRVWLDFRCDAPLGMLRFHADIFMEDPGGHRIVTELRVGDRVQEHLFTAGKATWSADASAAPLQADPAGQSFLAASPPAGAAAPTRAEPPPAESRGPPPFSEFFRQGVLHILLGLDHVLFVVALLIGVATPGSLLLIVTSFTIAHSITLALGALELVTPSARFVEPLIALSIVYVAAENLIRAEPRHRFLVTFFFGLLHGFGFSSVLRELGLPGSGIATALLGFNLGVEAGQLLILAVALPALHAVRRSPAAAARVRVAASAGIAVVALLWFAERVLDVQLLPNVG